MIKQFYFKQFNVAQVKFKWFEVLLCITNNSIKPRPFIYSLVNVQTVLFHTIPFNVRHLFALIVNDK